LRLTLSMCGFEVDPMSMRNLLLVCAIFAAARAGAQGMQMQMGGATGTITENVLRHEASGTSLEPGALVPPMLMRMTGNWMLMVHGVAFVADQQQSGPRGHDKSFSVNWWMPMAQRDFGSGQLTLRTMISLEAATVTGRYYPELFQQGETAFGKPIVDGQHPHNFFMEIAGIYDQRFGEKMLLTLYAAPVGDPSLGPVAFPHRASASEDQLAPLGHHLEDSTHISYDVVTAGMSAGGARGARVEASGFHGREPDENRWHVQAGAVDSWSGRLSVVPDAHWIGQYSLGRLHSPEALHPEEDILRQTASVSCHYGNATALDAMILWGRNHTVGSAEDANGYLLEATLHLRGRQSLWTRIEDVDRTSDLLGAANETVIGRVQAYTGGYAHTLGTWKPVAAEIGVQGTGYSTPASLIPEYRAHPWGVAAFVKFQLGK
jgi:hypothetical protein